MQSTYKPDNSGARQRGKITPQEREMIQKYLADLEREKARLQSAMQEEEEAARQPMVFGYVRCSHEDSKASGRGEDSQRDMILKWAEFLRNEISILPEVTWMQEEDPVSAYRVPLRHRSKGREMDRKLKRGDHVIFAYFDRVFRSTEDCLATLRDWKQRGIVAHFVNMRVDMDTALGDFFVTVIAATNQLDSAMKGERIKGVNAELMKEGRKSNGHPPMGFRLVGVKGKRRKMVVDWDTRRIMGEIVRVRDVYNWPWRKISDYVEEWLANKFNKKPTPPWERRLWSHMHCYRAYTEEMKLRQAGEKGDAARESA